MVGVGIENGRPKEQRILRGHVQVEHETTCANKRPDKERDLCALVRLQGISLRDLLLAFDQNTSLSLRI